MRKVIQLSRYFAEYLAFLRERPITEKAFEISIREGLPFSVVYRRLQKEEVR